jgi:uncharacterized protein (UPF0332 family)
VKAAEANCKKARAKEMLKLEYTYSQKRRSSTLLALGSSEFDAAEILVSEELYRESVIHMYFASYYISQALLVKHLKAKPSHKNVENTLHKQYGKHTKFPRRYVELHSYLHTLRNDTNYQSTHVPSPLIVSRKLAVLEKFLRYALKHVPRLEIIEIIKGIYDENKNDINDFGFDIYCPKTYAHHARLTMWQPPFYLDVFGPKQLATQAQKLLKSLRVKNSSDYVVGLNSKLDQYDDTHLIMLDIDSVDPAVESALKTTGGILLKSGRGFHFIGKSVIKGQTKWRQVLRKLLQNKDLKQFIDKDHIEISFDRGYSTLRVTESKTKPYIPFFYKQI